MPDVPKTFDCATFWTIPFHLKMYRKWNGIHLDLLDIAFLRPPPNCSKEASQWFCTVPWLSFPLWHPLASMAAKTLETSLLFPSFPRNPGREPSSTVLLLVWMALFWLYWKIFLDNAERQVLLVPVTGTYSLLHMAIILAVTVFFRSAFSVSKVSFSESLLYFCIQ